MHQGYSINSMKKILILLFFSTLNVDASDEMVAYDSSVFNSNLDMIKTKLNKVFFCGNLKAKNDPYYLYKVDLYEEKIIYADIDQNFMQIEPLVIKRDTKNITQFITPPKKDEGVLDDEDVWRRWYLDKLSLKISMRFFYDIPGNYDGKGKYLDPILYECLKELPESWGF
jgi:hypothetical protein